MRILSFISIYFNSIPFLSQETGATQTKLFIADDEAK